MIVFSLTKKSFFLTFWQDLNLRFIKSLITSHFWRFDFMIYPQIWRVDSSWIDRSKKIVTDKTDIKEMYNNPFIFYHVCFVITFWDRTYQSPKTYVKTNWLTIRDRSLFFAWRGGGGEDLGLNKMIFSRPPLCMLLHWSDSPLITFDDFRDSPLCLHFSSKFKWTPLWIFPKFSAIPSLWVLSYDLSPFSFT